MLSSPPFFPQQPPSSPENEWDSGEEEDGLAEQTPLDISWYVSHFGQLDGLGRFYASVVFVFFFFLQGASHCIFYSWECLFNGHYVA